MVLFKKPEKLRSGLSLILISLMMLLLVSLVSGCGNQDGKLSPGTNPPPASPAAEEKMSKITLYFSNNQAEKLVAEQREVMVKDESLAEAVVKELIKGPREKDLVKTIPEETRLLSLTVSEGVAQVNFSQEFQTKHWGGSSGESMTVYSVTNSLAEIDGIKKVQFLIDGKQVESLAGHIDLTQPITPDKDLIKK